MRDETKGRLRVVFQPLVRLLVALRVPPNAITVSGVVFSAGAGFFLSQGWFLLALVPLLLSGLADTVDGDVARGLQRAGGHDRNSSATNSQSAVRSPQSGSRGGFLDSTLDRASEFAVFFGMFWFYRQVPARAALVFAAFFASLAVSYVRARAEGIGIECRLGVFERPIRFLFLVLGIFGSLFYANALVIALAIILLGATLTVIQRMVHVIRKSI